MERVFNFLDKVIHIRDTAPDKSKYDKYEPLIERSDWRLLPEKQPRLGVQFDEDNPDTYRRIAIHPETPNKWILSDQEITTLREMAKESEIFDKNAVNRFDGEGGAK